MNATEAWLRQLSLLYHMGREVIPRGKRTLEVVGSQVKVDMLEPMVLWPSRKLSYKFMAGEAWWILAGSDRVIDIAPYNPKISQFSDDGLVFAGAYGPKVVDQLGYVVETLSQDLSSRQAVINIWREKPGPSKDVPCTLSLQFLAREPGVMDCVASMRSSDVWLGLPYDIFNFSMIAAYVALEVRKRAESAGAPLPRLRPGTLHLTMGSSHLYEENFGDALNALSTWRGDPVSEQHRHLGDFRPDMWFNSGSTLILWLFANAQRNWDAAMQLTGQDHCTRWYEESVRIAKMEDRECAHR